MKANTLAVAALCAATMLNSAVAAEAGDGSQLRAQVTGSYPSLRYVERYRHDFPDEKSGVRFTYHLSGGTPGPARTHFLGQEGAARLCLRSTASD